MSRLATLLALVLLLVPGTANHLRAEVVAVRAKRVFTGDGAPLEPGVILVKDGRIQAVGADLAIPAGARRLEVDGTITPGWIDASSNAGILGRAAEEYEEVTPEIQVIDTIDVDQKSFRRALEAGVTTVAIGPGARNVIGGLGAIVRTAPGDFDSTVVDDEAFLAMSMALDAVYGNRSMRGAAPYSIYYRIPTTRMGTVFLIRRAFTESLKRTGDPGDLEIGVGKLTSFLTPAGREVLRQCAAGKKRVRIRADNKQEIRAALLMASEVGFDLTIEGALEAGPLIPLIREAKASLLIRPGAYFETHAKEDPAQFLDLSQALAREGIPFAFMTAYWGSSAQLLPGVRLDVRFGLSEEHAVRAVTSDAARILGIDSTLGSIAPGKRADLVAFSGRPFSMTTRVLWVMTDGEIHGDLSVEN